MAEPEDEGTHGAPAPGHKHKISLTTWLILGGVIIAAITAWIIWKRKTSTSTTTTTVATPTTTKTTKTTTTTAGTATTTPQQVTVKVTVTQPTTSPSQANASGQPDPTAASQAGSAPVTIGTSASGATTVGATAPNVTVTPAIVSQVSAATPKLGAIYQSLTGSGALVPAAVTYHVSGPTGDVRIGSTIVPAGTKAAIATAQKRNSQTAAANPSAQVA